jgi:putative addiction module component (TIGR02574 family)
MSASLKQLEEQARSLSAEERAKLAQSMLESLHAPQSEVESAWAEEIERRVAAFDRGEINTGSRVFKNARTPASAN